MNTQKIGILTDSGTDVPAEYAGEHGIRIVPLSIHFGDDAYEDGVISRDMLYKRIETEVAKTSLPASERVTEAFEAFEREGYTHVLAITISGALSGTNGMIALMARDYPKLDVRAVDTKNIGIAAGFSVMRAVEMIEEGLGIDEIERALVRDLRETRVFFYVPTLEFLRRGGRIGKVAATIGIALGIRPIISCDEDGAYHTVAKPRGEVKALAAAVKIASDFAMGYVCRVAVAHANALETAQRVRDDLKKHLGSVKSFFEGEISAALSVHSGPGLVGIAIERVRPVSEG